MKKILLGVFALSALALTSCTSASIPATERNDKALSNETRVEYNLSFTSNGTKLNKEEDTTEYTVYTSTDLASSAFVYKIDVDKLIEESASGNPEALKSVTVNSMYFSKNENADSVIYQVEGGQFANIFYSRITNPYKETYTTFEGNSWSHNYKFTDEDIALLSDDTKSHDLSVIYVPAYCEKTGNAGTLVSKYILFPIAVTFGNTELKSVEFNFTTPSHPLPDDSEDLPIFTSCIAM